MPQFTYGSWYICDLICFERTVKSTVGIFKFRRYLNMLALCFILPTDNHNVAMVIFLCSRSLYGLMQPLTAWALPNCHLLIFHFWYPTIILSNHVNVNPCCAFPFIYHQPFEMDSKLKHLQNLAIFHQLVKSWMGYKQIVFFCWISHNVYWIHVKWCL